MAARKVHVNYELEGYDYQSSNILIDAFVWKFGCKYYQIYTPNIFYYIYSMN